MGKKKVAKSSHPSKAAKAVQSEAEGRGAEFSFRGETFTTLPIDDMPIEVLEATDEGNGLKALRLMLGDEAWSRFKALRPTFADLAEFSAELADAMGAGDPGN